MVQFTFDKSSFTFCPILQSNFIFIFECVIIIFQLIQQIVNVGM